jgi:hypothetical protein
VLQYWYQHTKTKGASITDIRETSTSGSVYRLGHYLVALTAVNPVDNGPIRETLDSVLMHDTRGAEFSRFLPLAADEGESQPVGEPCVSHIRYPNRNGRGI